MKRLVVLLVALSVPFLAACEPPEGSPPCTNITGGGGQYIEGGTVLFSVDLEADPCRDVKYRFFVDDEEGGPRLATATYRGTNTNGRVDFAVTVADDDPTVCVSARTIAADGQRLDLAPDVGCVELTIGEPPSGRRFS
jgi:hypothetical protein